MSINRPRRLRSTEYLRDLVRENQLTINDLIYPIFVVEGINQKQEIQSMPGQYRYSIDRLNEVISLVEEAGVKSILIFGISNTKDEEGTSSFDDNSIVCQAIKKIKSLNNKLFIITDVCVCAYTTHGHCGILNGNDIDNDKSLKVLANMALAHAKAGADMVAPSAMMDNQVEAIRNILDSNGFSSLPIMGYSAKFYSSWYGPFREAANSAPSFGNRATYQMDIANSNEALREVELDIEQGADIVMVKPGILYLDIIKSIADNYNIPIAVYNVSGEYAALKAAGANGWLNEKEAMLEMLMAFKRAGAKLIITYFALEAAKYLNK